MSDIKKLKEAYAEVVSGKVEEIVEETVSEDIDPELLKKAAVGKKKADDEEKDGKKAVPAGKDVDVDDEKSDDDDKEKKPVPPKKKKKEDDEEEVEEDNTNDKSDDGEGLDKVQPKATKKKFKDRKDKDIDNDGDVDDSDKFLHKRRKAVSKAMASESYKEASDALWEALVTLSEKKTADTAEGEAIDSKESPKSKEFIDAHKKSDKKIEDNYDDAVDKTTKAGKGGPSPKKRPGDNANGDSKPKGVKEQSELIKRTLEQLRK
jgi:hypothetical protein